MSYWRWSFSSTTSHHLFLLHLLFLPGHSMPAPMSQLLRCTTTLFQVLYCKMKNVSLIFGLFFMYYFCEKYCKHITVQYHIANCVSWVPKLFLLDLHACSQNGTCLHVRDLLYSLLHPLSFSSKTLHCNAIHQKECVIVSLRASLWRTIISWKEMCKEVCRLLLLDTPPIISWVCSFRSDCYPMDCSLPDSSVPGILQARILEWAAIFFIEVY